MLKSICKSKAALRAKFQGWVKHRILLVWASKSGFVVSLLMVSAAVSYADDAPFNPFSQSPSYYSNYVFNNEATKMLERDHKILFPENSPSPPPVSSGGSKSTKAPVSPSGKPTPATINKLTSAFPAELRPQAKQLYTALYRAYGQIEKSLGIPKYDVAGAFAAFIAANYIALNNVEVPDADFKVLVGQTRNALRKSRAFAKLKPTKKRELYEQLAIMSTFTAATQFVLQQQPDADLSSRLQDAARLNLESLLNVSADQVFITSSGLVII